MPHQHRHHRQKLTSLASVVTSAGSSITVGNVVLLSNGQCALVRSLFQWDRRRDGRYAHMQLARKANVTPRKHLFLCDRVCSNIRTCEIRRRLDGVSINFVLEQGRAMRDPLPPARHDRTRESGDPFVRTRCDSCLSTEQRRRARARPLADGSAGFTSHGVTYHAGDAVWICTAEPQWQPALLIEERVEGWRVRLLGRVKDLSTRASERELYLTDRYSTIITSAVVGKTPINAPGVDSYTCTLRLPGHSPQVKTSLVAACRPPKPCIACYPAPDSATGLAQLRLPAVDLYAGGGGSTYGLNQYFDVQHAVDTDIASCATLRTNFPQLHVHERSVASYMDSRRAPARGSVAVLFAGPPCQGHSRANHVRDTQDMRNLEIFRTLEEVDRLRPDVFVLENVPGIKDTVLTEDGQVNFATELLKGLARLGYQCRVALLCARAYGSAQNRRRLFFLGARSDIPLPHFPPPTHADPAPMATLVDIGGTCGDKGFHIGPRGPVTASSATHIARGMAPLQAITAFEAVSDFPRFNYEENVIGLRDGAAYRYPPSTEYQREARAAQIRRGRDTISDHITPDPTPSQREMCLSAPRADEERHGRQTECRADPVGGFATLMTNAMPGGKSSGTIHWSQHRVFSVAERRRVQGLPDHYRLCGTVEEKNRQLGNMVDAHVAEAIARAIKVQVYEPYWREQGMPDSTRFWRLWRERYPVQ